jgi:hypothetical protein
MVLKTFKILFSRSEMRTNSNRIKFNGKNLLETRTKKQILADEAAKAAGQNESVTQPGSDAN